MINLLTFFKNHFDSSEFSNANWLRFVESHLQRMIRKNANSLYDERITLLRTAIEAFKKALNEEDTSFAQQQAQTKRTNDLIANFKSSVSQKEGIVRGTWGIGSPVYIEFFPQGLTEYAQATKGNISILMNRIAAKAQKYAADLAPSFVDMFVDFASQYNTIRAEQLTSIGDVAADKTLVHETRFALSVLVMQNLHFVAFRHVGDADGGMDFFDQSIIRRAGSNTIDEGEIFTGEVEASTTVTVIENISPDMTLVITNTGTTPLTFSASSEADVIGSGSLTVAAGDTVTERISQITAEAEEGWFFVATNPSAEVLGSYSVERLP